MKNTPSRAARGIAATVAVLLWMVFAAVPAFADPPANDDFEAAEVIATIPHTETIKTLEATSAESDPFPSCGNSSRERSVWYSYTPVQSEQIAANTLESSYNTILSVWTGAAGSLAEVACNDDAGGSQSRVFLDTVAGQTYYFLITSYGGPGGSLTFTLREPPAAPEMTLAVEDIGWVNISSGRAVISGELICSPSMDASVYVELSQRQGGKLVAGSGYASLRCDGTERWMIIARAGNKEFLPKTAGIDAEAVAFVPEGGAVSSAASISSVLRACTIIGTLGDDTIRGTAKDDMICSMAGNDTLIGRGGNDRLRGHDGNDTISGGSGKDLLTGGYGDDAISGQGGDDTLYGDAGNDFLNGGPGKDTCYRGGGDNNLKSCERRKA